MKTDFGRFVKKVLISVHASMHRERDEAMATTKRKLKRFELPLTVLFRPAQESAGYMKAITRNISGSGLCLESRDSAFTQNDSLEMNLKLPDNKSSVMLLGDVAWKKQFNGKNLAGICFKVKNRGRHKKDMESLFSAASLPKSSLTLKDSVQAKRKGAKAGITGKASAAKKPSALEEPAAGFTKRYLKDGHCSVTFRLPAAAAPEAREVTLVGDFNKWDGAASPMARLKNGDFRITMKLEAGKEYRFRYLIDGSRWENDWSADRYVPNRYGTDDSLVIL